jgi:hypothetical protein
MKQNIEIILWVAPLVVTCGIMLKDTPSTAHLVFLLISFIVAFVGIGVATKE